MPNLIIPNTNNISLILYAGTLNGSGDTLTNGWNGNINYPGVARNFQIYGLPSLTSITYEGNATVVGTIYAPEATVSGGVNGASVIDTSGAIVANQINCTGHWNFHYDQSLATNGPVFWSTATGQGN